MKKDLFMVLPVILAALMLAGCSRKAETEVAPVRVKVADGLTSVVQKETLFSGTVEEDQAISLSFPVPGTVKQVLVSEGRRVSKGQLLAVIDDTSLRSAYASAKATLTQAEDAYRRMKQLHDSGSLPDIQWVDVESKLEQARSMEEIARKNLADVRLTAPASGIISRKSTEVGQQAAPGIEVLRMIDVARVKMKISLPEKDMAFIHIGIPAMAEVEALGSRAYDIKVSEIGTTANPLTRSYEVKFSVGNSDGALRPGMLCTVKLAMDTSATSGDDVVIPATAVMLTERNTHYVWVVREGKAHRQDVTIGGTAARGVHILGIDSASQIITEGMQKVYEDCPVTIVK